MEKLQEKVWKSSLHGFPVNSYIQDGIGDHKSDEDDDEDSEYEANEETALETYITPLDSDDTKQDEYVVFKEVMQSK